MNNIFVTLLKFNYLAKHSFLSNIIFRTKEETKSYLESEKKRSFLCTVLTKL